jgi:hypothetical protein
MAVHYAQFTADANDFNARIAESAECFNARIAGLAETPIRVTRATRGDAIGLNAPNRSCDSAISAIAALKKMCGQRPASKLSTPK